MALLTTECESVDLGIPGYSDVFYLLTADRAGQTLDVAFIGGSDCERHITSPQWYYNSFFAMNGIHFLWILCFFVDNSVVFDLKSTLLCDFSLLLLRDRQ